MQNVFASMTAEMSLNEKLHVVSFLKNMNDYHIKNTINSFLNWAIIEFGLTFHLADLFFHEL